MDSKLLDRRSMLRLGSDGSATTVSPHADHASPPQLQAVNPPDTNLAGHSLSALLVAA